MAGQAKKTVENVTLRCAEVMHALPDFLDGRMGAEESQHIRWHLNHCPDCGFVVRRARETLKDILQAAGVKIRQSTAA